MMFVRTLAFFLGVLATLFLGWAALVGIPEIQISDDPQPGLQRYSYDAYHGRSIYIREGCVYCHSQQTRPQGFGSDQDRRWGRPSVPGDYVYDQPHLLGTMRTGPDLFNIAKRQPSADWHLTHLYNPRATSPGSLMPSFKWLFEEKVTAGPNDRMVIVPEQHAPRGKVVVAKPEALNLVAYLLSLDHTYPVVRPRADTDWPSAKR